MKTCPNCGSKMDPSVNFCTNCGSDLRNVPTDEEKAQATQMTQTMPEQPVQPTADQTASRATRTRESQRSTQPSQSTMADTQATQNTYNATQPTNFNNQQYNGGQNFNDQNQYANGQNFNNQNQYGQGQPGMTTGQRFTQAVQTFDAHNMWLWFVNSWKHPFAEQNAERWYGWVTLLVEDIVFGLGLFIGEQRATGAVDSSFGSNLMGASSNFTFGIMIELILFIALAQVAWLGAAYLAYKVIYGHSKDFMELTNHVVQTSNLSAIFIAVFFVFMVLMGPAGAAVSIFMVTLAVGFFSMALTVVILGDPNPVHDKFYGYFLFTALQFIAGFIITLIISATIMSQIGSSFSGMF